MKKSCLAIVLLFAVLFLPVISLWGTSFWEGTAAVSANPQPGFYIETNSFPKNTVVEIKNLETEKTIRAIVIAGLDAPGLLAVLSREAAETVGLQSRTVGRIRITSLSDPVAYSRFTEEYRSGDPDFDPQAAVDSVYGRNNPSATPPQSEYGGGPVPTEPRRVIPGRDWTDVPLVPLVTAPVVQQEETDSSDIQSGQEGLSSALPDTVPNTIPDSIPDTISDSPEINDAIALVSGSESPVVFDLPAVSLPAVPVEPEKKLPEKVETERDAAAYEYSLIPAEERPPYGSVIPPRTADSVVQIFSVRAVSLSQLEMGKFYLQITASRDVSAVEFELAKLKDYPRTVLCMEDTAFPYRILIGPVNQGESGALLRKFQVMGYKDAFIRRREP
ncbi:MAG: SPOR domain-containing protein [Treponema sp.]|jgi:hypothetical protein|nr:SPOR domain-containing protein [Treponema sp.]